MNALQVIVPFGLSKTIGFLGHQRMSLIRSFKMVILLANGRHEPGQAYMLGHPPVTQVQFPSSTILYPLTSVPNSM